jgi:hypothetical protein
VTTTRITIKRAQLERQRSLVLDFLARRLELEDWGSVSEARGDLLAIDLKLRALAEAAAE